MLQSAIRSLDLDILQGEQELAGYACTQVKKEFDIQVSVDLHGVWPEELLSRKILTQHDFAFRSVRSFEEKLFKSVDNVITCSPEMRNLLVYSYGLNKNKVFPLVNGSFIHEFPIEPKEKGIMKVVHAGLLSELENAKLFVRAMPLVNAKLPGVQFYLTKKGNLLGEIIANIHKHNLKVNFFYYPDPNDFFKFLSSCDVAVLTSQSSLTRMISYPAKLFDYLSVGLPIVANDIGSWSRIISTTQSGILTKSSPEDLANGIVTILQNPELANRFHANGIKAISREYNWNNLVSKLVKFYISQLNFNVRNQLSDL